MCVCTSATHERIVRTDFSRKYWLIRIIATPKFDNDIVDAFHLSHWWRVICVTINLEIFINFNSEFSKLYYGDPLSESVFSKEQKNVFSQERIK